MRKPLQVVSATKASSNSPFFSSTRKDKDSSVTKMFGTTAIEPVVKSKTPVVFTAPKPQGFSSCNLPRPKPDSSDGYVSDGHPFSEDLGSTIDDLRNNSNDVEKPFMLQSLLSSRKSKKLDFIIKDSKNSKSSVMKTNQDKIASASSAPLITRSSASSSTITKLSSSSSTSPKSSSVIAESTISSNIAKSSSMMTTSLPSTTMNSSSIETKLSISSSTIITSCTASKRIREDEKIDPGLSVDQPFITSKDEDRMCKQSSIKQEMSLAVHINEADKDDQFSNSVFSGTIINKDSKTFDERADSSQSRDHDPLVYKGEKQHINVEKPERKKLKVSRKSAKFSSRRALQEVRIQGLKNDIKNSIQDLEIGYNVSLTPSPPDATPLQPPSVSENEFFSDQQATPSPNDVDKPCVPKSGTQSSSSSSTNSSAGLDPSTKTTRDWMHLFEEPFPRRSPRLSCLPTAAKDYEYLMDNFSPLTSRMRSKGRNKQSRRKNTQEKTTTQEDVKDESATSKEVTRPVSPLVLVEEQTSQTPASENGEKKKKGSLKRPKTVKLDKNILTKRKSNISVHQPNSLVPSASLDESEDDLFHFPRPPAVLSCPGGPYSMVVDFALPDKDYAKLKLAKIKGNQTKKTATKECQGAPSSYDSKEEQKLGQKVLTNNGNKSKIVDKDKTSNGEGLASLAANNVNLKVNIMETRGTKDEREISAIPRDISDKYENQSQENDASQCKEEDDNGYIPATPNAKTNRTISTDNKSSDNLERVSQNSDSENALSGSILQNLQVQSIVNKDAIPVKKHSMDETDFLGYFENKYLNSVASASMVRHGPESSVSSVEKRCPKMLKTSLCCVENQPENTQKPSLETGRSNPLEEKNKMNGNVKGIKSEKLPLRKECVPSSQGSSDSQSPNALKGLLLLNGGVKKNSHPNPVSNHPVTLDKQHQGQEAGSDTLDDSENTSDSRSPVTVLLQSKNRVDVVQDAIEDVPRIADVSKGKQEDNTLVFGCLEMPKVSSDEESQEKTNLSRVGDVTDKVSKNNPKSKMGIEMVSVVNQITVSQPGLDKTLSFSLGDTQMDSPSQVTEGHCGLDSSIPSSFLSNTGMGSIVNQESRNLECAQTSERKIENPLHGITAPSCSNTEEFDDTPGSIKGSLPLYSNPEECIEQLTVPDGSFPLCPETEEFAHTGDVPLYQSNQEFCVADSASSEPSMGDTATPYGKAKVPQESSVMDTELDQMENSVLTPVLMQACLQVGVKAYLH